MSTPGLAATERDFPSFTPIIHDGPAVIGTRDGSTAVTSRSSELIIQGQEQHIRMPVFDQSEDRPSGGIGNYSIIPNLF